MRTILRRSALTLATLCGTVAAFAGYLHWSGNFHAVIPGILYRSAQMDGPTLERWSRDNGLATILNLRGASDGETWYDSERAVSARLGLRHIDFALSAQKELSDAQVTALVALMRDAPKPLLIHCKRGADRTGLAVALYVGAIEGGSEFDAEIELSPLYGHVATPWLGKTWAMDATWERMEPRFGMTES